MEKEKQSPKFLRQRKFLLALPVLALPFLTLAFWALGGGSVQQTNAQSGIGLNKELPGVTFKNGKEPDKMSYYSQADIDSAKLADLKKNDPFYKQDTGIREIDIDQERLGFNGGNFLSTDRNIQTYQGSGYHDQNEQKVYQKLNKLNVALAQNEQSYRDEQIERDFSRPNNGSIDNDVERLERMMESMQQGEATDPEMAQLNTMLERIAEIQNPELVQEKLRKSSEQKRGRVFAVSSGKKPDPVSSLDKVKTGYDYDDTILKLKGQDNGFYSLDNQRENNSEQNAIEAVIAENQTIVSGSTVKMKLVSDIFINGIKIPKGNLVFGLASLSGERLGVKINSIRYNNSLFPVELSVFDLDGLDGLYIPGAISREVAKESADRGLQNIGFTSLDPSIGMQAAGMGVEAAKSLFSKKVKLIRVTIKAGYQILLRDEKQKQQN